jgi:hypothetical protein
MVKKAYQFDYKYDWITDDLSKKDSLSQLNY